MRTFKSVKDLFKDPTVCVSTAQEIINFHFSEKEKTPWPYEIQISIDDLDILCIRLEYDYGTDTLKIPVRTIHLSKGHRKMWHKATTDFDLDCSQFMLILNRFGYSY